MSLRITFVILDQLNGLLSNGLAKGVSVPLLPSPLGIGGMGALCIISVIDLSRSILITSGLMYCFLSAIKYHLI